MKNRKFMYNEKIVFKELGSEMTNQLVFSG